MSEFKMTVVSRQEFEPPTTAQMRALRLTGTRVSRYALPRAPMRCPKVCVYAVEGVCDEPRTNKGNGDAYCHTRGNKAVLAWLTPITASDSTSMTPHERETANDETTDDQR